MKKVTYVVYEGNSEHLRFDTKKAAITEATFLKAKYNQFGIEKEIRIEEIIVNEIDFSVEDEGMQEIIECVLENKELSKENGKALCKYAEVEFEGFLSVAKAATKVGISHYVVSLLKSSILNAKEE